MRSHADETVDSISTACRVGQNLASARTVEVRCRAAIRSHELAIRDHGVTPVPNEVGAQRGVEGPALSCKRTVEVLDPKESNPARRLDREPRPAAFDEGQKERLDCIR